jgi:hypothetical protein
MVFSEIIDTLKPNLGTGKLRIFQLFSFASPINNLKRTLHTGHASSSFLSPCLLTISSAVDRQLLLT